MASELSYALTVVTDGEQQSPKPQTVPTLTEENLNKHFASLDEGSGAKRERLPSEGSRLSCRSSRSMLSERAKRKQAAKQAAEDGPTAWPDETAYEKRSLFYFTLKDPIRRAAIFAIEWPKRGSSFWDKKVLAIIMLNTCTMAMFDCFDKPSMRMCDPAEENTPAGPYGYCNKMGTGIISQEMLTHSTTCKLHCKLLASVVTTSKTFQHFKYMH